MLVLTRFDFLLQVSTKHCKDRCMQHEPCTVRVYLALNLKPSEAEVLDALAEEQGLTRMTLARALVRREIYRRGQAQQQEASHAA